MNEELEVRGVTIKLQVTNEATADEKAMDRINMLVEMGLIEPQFVNDKMTFFPTMVGVLVMDSLQPFYDRMTDNKKRRG